MNGCWKTFCLKNLGTMTEEAILPLPEERERERERD